MTRLAVHGPLLPFIQRLDGVHIRFAADEYAAAIRKEESMAIARSPRKAASKHVLLAVHIGQAREVSVTGDFTGWSAEGVPLLRGPQGDWHVTLRLAPGAYQYRLLVDGSWRDDPCASRRVPNPFGTENCILVVE